MSDYLDYEGLLRYNELVQRLLVSKSAISEGTDLSMVTTGEKAIWNAKISSVEAAAGANINSVGTPSVTTSTSNGVTTLTFNNLKGATGSNGSNGTSAAWFTGTVVTGTGTSGISASVSGSKAGDMYLNTSNANVYKATAANTWGYVCNIKGVTGSNGSNGTNGTSAAWFSGTAVTGTSTTATSFTVSGSKAGDMYLNTSTSNVYSASAANSWIYVCNIKGAAGTNATTTSLASTSANGLLRQLNSASVSSQTQSTKFLREDGTWAAPSYTTYKININGTDTGGGTTSLGTIYGATTAGTSGQYLKSSGSGAPTWTSIAYSEIGYTVNATSSAGGTLSLAGTTPLHVVTLTGNVSALTLSVNPAEGHSCHVIFTAAAEHTVAIAHDATNRICPDAEDVSLTIPAGGYVEINFLCANNKVYVRGV